MQVEIKKLPKSTLQLEVTIPATNVEEVRKLVLNKFSETMEVKGFRKGNAPIDLVEKSLDPAKFNGEVVNTLLEKYYVEALKENKIAPISNPKVEIKAFGEYKDFVFTATVAIRPDVKIGDYKKALKKKTEEKKAEIQKQKEAALKEGKSLENFHDHLHTDEIIDVLTESAELEIPEMLIEDEIDRYMARLVDQMQAINMQMEQYLKAQKKTAEQVREEFASMAEKNLKAEFAMAQIIKDSGITVTDAEIEETAKASGDPQVMENLKDPTTKWYIKSIIEKNKLLASIMDELEIPYKSHEEEEKRDADSKDKEKK